MDASTEQPGFAWDDATSASKFAEYHAANPQLYVLLQRFAFQALDAGWKRLSINLLFERVRWETGLETHGDAFKVNNTWRAYYARLLMQNEPRLAGLFEIRHSKADEELQVA